ncbi:MAG TPA: type II toxin-antitoxin system VapC family toxin [Caulobacteraceae bacterium]|nr:type II toxin-antitoxin system VapC family toxin [Caulobacteraceae bacterium]
MVIDSSALVAILLDEPERELFTRVIVTGGPAVMSAAGYLECGMVMVSRFGPAEGRFRLDGELERLGIAISAVTREQASSAIDGFVLYGKRRHKADLNFGDCFAYGLARTLGSPLLFKGDDFALTDVRSALPQV